ncbi:hypothetical protein, partial [Mesorhizobium sp. M1D.F.Ca.ET.234.01.1.1]|uniref:hypothetical protein n=1 Tax=Mesorhizobium sp. M1D.F.Ca.ET.234.01.1.1 TaxID=2563932 RepID=UPI001AEDA96B
FAMPASAENDSLVAPFHGRSFSPVGWRNQDFGTPGPTRPDILDWDEAEPAKYRKSIGKGSGFSADRGSSTH